VQKTGKVIEILTFIAGGLFFSKAPFFGTAKNSTMANRALP
jgi:hypothetical protein